MPPRCHKKAPETDARMALRRRTKPLWCSPARMPETGVVFVIRASIAASVVFAKKRWHYPNFVPILKRRV